MILDENILLSNGEQMPRLALGTWFMEKRDVATAINQALTFGYRRLDIDANFPNLTEVGNTLRQHSRRPFITVKLPNNVTGGNVASTIKQILQELQVDHVDMLMLRKKSSWVDTLAVWQSLIEALQRGQANLLGVMDFSKDDLQELVGDSLTFPMVDQVVVRIGQTPHDLLRYNRANNVVTEAYSPVPHGLAIKAPVVAKVAAKYGVSINQLCLRYVWQLGLAMWRQTTNPHHMAENANIDFHITEQDMETLNNLQIKE